LGAKFYLEIVGGSLLILLGILFFLYLPQTFSEISTVAIFVVGGVLIIRKAVLDWTREKIREETTRSTQKKNSQSKSGTKTGR
jgi:hypothetical protein